MVTYLRGIWKLLSGSRPPESLVPLGHQEPIPPSLVQLELPELKVHREPRPPSLVQLVHREPIPPSLVPLVQLVRKAIPGPPEPRPPSLVQLELPELKVHREPRPPSLVQLVHREPIPPSLVQLVQLVRKAIPGPPEPRPPSLVQLELPELKVHREPRPPSLVQLVHREPIPPSLVQLVQLELPELKVRRGARYGNRGRVLSWQRTSAPTITVTDNESVQLYGLRTYQRFDLVCEKLSDVERAAGWTLAQRRLRTVLSEPLVLNPDAQEGMSGWDLATDLELGDRHEVVWETDPAEPAITYPAWVQSIEHRIGVDLWTVAVGTSEIWAYTPAAGWDVDPWDTALWATELEKES